MKRQTGSGVRFIVQAALIAAVYAALTVGLAPISYGMMQVRVSEALCVLPIFTPAAVPGLAVGCLIANLFGGFGLPDIVFGTLATLLAAVCTYLLRKNTYVALAPPVLFNAFMVGSVLFYQMTEMQGVGGWLAVCGSVGFGELIACYFGGVPLALVLRRYAKSIFRLDRTGGAQ